MANFNSTTKVEEENQERIWSNLPVDITGKIMEKLCWIDRVRLSAVFKIPRGLIPPPCLDFPWILTLSSVAEETNITRKKFELFDLSRTKYYDVEELIDVSVNSRICDSSFGWLLLRTVVKPGKIRWELFSPLTGDHIMLPAEQEHSDRYCGVSSDLIAATLFMNPTSPECTVFVFWQDRWSAGFGICRVRVGDTIWTTFILAQYMPYLDDQYHLNLHPCDATYLDGSFYCLFRDGEVGVFNIQRQEWKLLEDSCQKPYYFVTSKREWYSKSTCNLHPTYCFVNSCTDILACEVLWQLAWVWRYDFSDTSWNYEQGCVSKLAHEFVGDGFHGGGISEFTDKVPPVYDYYSSTLYPTNLYRSVQGVCDWLYKEKIVYSNIDHPNAAGVQKIWFDYRLIWRKKDLFLSI